jgi:transglutaminase-like putative cysteine protease
MKKTWLLLGLILLAGLATTGYVSATPSADFHEVNGEVFDDWDICRTRSFGKDGFYQISEAAFRPVIVFESLGEGAALAHRLGEQFVQKYPDPSQRAEAIFRFVRDRVKYTSDIDRFDYDEFAQNADELAVAIDQNGTSYGDCEDSATLLAVMYKAAGYRSAIAVGSGHTAALVYLPDYKKASAVFKLDGEPGWIWAEATGKNNPLGWVSKEFIGVELATYEIGEETMAPTQPSTAPSVAVAEKGKSASSNPLPFSSIILLLWILPLFRRRRAR